MIEELKFDVLVGKTIRDAQEIGDERISFVMDDGSRFDLYHLQDCCEDVRVDSIDGDLGAICGSPLVVATEEIYSNETPEGVLHSDDRAFDDSYTWTVYTLQTATARCVIRWFGTSNGYYSETVYFGRV